MAKKRPGRGAIWINTRFKKFGKWMAQGSYNLKRGDRHFILTDVNTKKTRVYESHEVAKRAGWEKKK